MHAPSKKPQLGIKNIGCSIKQELPICGCILLEGYNNDPLYPEGTGVMHQGKCLPVQVVSQWQSGKKQAKEHQKSSACWQTAAAVTYHYSGCKDTEQFSEKNQNQNVCGGFL